MFDKSVATVLVAVELYNKPYFSYCEESFVLFITHAREILLKAKWLKESDNEKSCLYVKINKRGYEKTHVGIPKTHGFDKIIGLLRSKNLLPNCVVQNLEVFRELRNSVEHFLTENKALKGQILKYAIANLQNFRLLAKEWFNSDLDSLNVPVPLSVTEPTPSVAFSAKRESKDVRLLLSYVEQQAQNASNPQSPYAVRLEYALSFKKDNKNGIPIKYDENGIPVELTDAQIFSKFPYTYNTLLDEIKKQYPNVKRNKKFNDRMEQLRQREKALWYERKLDPEGSKTQKKNRYSKEFLEKMINICENEVPL